MIARGLGTDSGWDTGELAGGDEEQGETRVRRDLIVKTKSLAGTSDLTLLAPIKPGLVPALDAVSYKTRVKRLLRTLSMARTSSHEFALLRPFSDAVERVGRIHSVRVAVVESEDKVLLAATFDGTWEPYIRVLWQKVGALLDVIFCNTVDYVSAVDNTFEAWLAWAQRVQIETDFFYGLPGSTVVDGAYLRRQELLQRIDDDNLTPLRRSDMSRRERLADLELAAPPPGAKDRRVLALRHREHSVELIAQRNAMDKSAEAALEAARQGLQALAVVYRLTDLFVPDSEDGKFLQRATRELLLEFVEMIERVGGLPVAFKEEARKRFSRQLDWLGIKEPPRLLPQLPTTRPQFDRADVQAGIVRPCEGMTHGCLVLLGFTSAAAGKAFARAMLERVTSDANAAPSELTVNVALTHEGLRAMGLTEAQLQCFPAEFREGMAARSSVLGDFRINHPRRWNLPCRNWPQAASDATPIDLSAVHALIQLRVGGGDVSRTEVTDPVHPLHAAVAQYASLGEGVRLLSVQSMVKHEREHFGFAEGASQPSIDPPAQPLQDVQYINQIQLGELLCGYDNAVDRAVDPTQLPTGPGQVQAIERHGWLHNSTFLAVRKLGQDVEALETAISKITSATLPRAAVLAKMMGRELNGDALIPGKFHPNDFNYGSDPHGATCPLHAHIRRANPRSVPGINESPGARLPRLTRRGMSYGSRYDFSQPPDAAVNQRERGLVFMAYGASIAEQFEVVQRWLTGGNATNGYSGHSDPFLGVAPNAQPRFFSFEHEAQAVSVQLDGTWKELESYRPIVRLQWGLYLFTPSLKALQKLAQLPPAVCPMHDLPWSAISGEQQIRRLRALEFDQGEAVAAIEWKRVLEDAEARDRFVSASVWSAIRNNHGGALKTPYGVLIADRDIAMTVFEDREQRYSVMGYHGRMRQSIGEIYLGLDRNTPEGAYERQSRRTNAAIKNITRSEAFELAQRHTRAVLQQFIDDARRLPNPSDVNRWELTIDAREITDKVLAVLCQEWFGLPTGPAGELLPGSANWAWQPGEPPLYPGHFTAPSRYIFQPRPGELVERYGMLYGQSLTRAFIAFIRRHLDQRTVPQALSGGDARIARAIFDAFPGELTSHEELARTFVGALMGFLPTVDGNLRLSLHEWLGDGTFWSLRTAWAGKSFNNDVAAHDVFGDALARAMQLRPVPELVWRTALRHHEIGPNKLKIAPGETVVIAIVSATQQSLEHCRSDVLPIFGGDAFAAPAPTHACPGYAAAMGMMLGVLAALLTAPFSMRPSPAPVALVLDGSI